MTDALHASDLARVRRFEAAGFRAWPAASVHYDGTWAIRLTASNAAKRLNSVNPLDPADAGDIAARIARAASRFDAYGRPLVMRLSPLASPEIARHLDGEGWTSFSRSLVMTALLERVDLSGVMDQLPVRDIGRFAAAHLAVRGLEPGLRAGVSEVVERIEPEAGLFLYEASGVPVTTAICVHDGDLAGLFEVATTASRQREGLGRTMVLSALKWAKHRGARIAWLQVEADNLAALDLYKSIGFSPLYDYLYYQKIHGGAG